MLSVTLEKTNFPYSYQEELKQLRTNIEFSGTDKKVILITSAYANEGKSTLSLELARSFAELGKNVLLLDADMRLSELANKRVGNNPPPKGLSHLLSGQAPLEHVLYKTNTPRLYTIFAGRVPPNPSELLSNTKMSNLIEWSREYFDIVLIDTPPIKVVTDASVVAPLTDGAIMLIKANKVSRKDAQTALKQFDRVNCPILGVVLNQVKQNSTTYKKRGYGYGYYRKSSQSSGRSGSGNGSGSSSAAKGNKTGAGEAK